MADVVTKHCDECNTAKGETNHWLVAITRPQLEGIIFEPLETVELPRRDDFTYDDICGQECAHKRLSRFLSELNDKFTAKPSEKE